MRKQILAVMVGLTVILGGCSKQSTESMLQEVKKDTKEIKSGKVTMVLSISDENSSSLDNINYVMSGEEKFDPLELKMNGQFTRLGRSLEIEDYIKDGVHYSKTRIGGKWTWSKKKDPTDNTHALSFKSESINMQEGTLNLLDNKDNWDIIKDGDKVTFKLKKTDELKNKVKEIHLNRIKQEARFTESDYNFDYNIEYVFNTKTKDVEKLAYEITIKTEGTASKATTKGSLEEINKEVKVELPEESKNAIEEGK